MEETKYHCEQEGCGKSFETPAQLRGHKMSHSTKPSARTAERKKRIPLGTPVRQLSLPNKPKGKQVRWINDNWARHPDRIQQALQADYEFIDATGQVVGDGDDGNQNLGSRLSRPVGTNPDGSPITAYVMAIDKELFDEDQKIKLVEVDKIDAAIKGGKHKNALGDHGYIPNEGRGISFQVET